MCIEKKLHQHFILFASAILLLAVFLRLSGLGNPALSENEAINAIYAAQVYGDTGVNQFGQILYVLPTAILLQLFGVNNWVVRIIPALCGILFCLLPLLLRDTLSDKKSLLLALILAVDPLMLYWSKQADALMPVICSLAFCVFMFSRGHSQAGSIFLAIVVCGGERFWPFVIAIFVALGLLWVVGNAFFCGSFQPFNRIWTLFSRRNLIIFTISLLCFSTAFFTFPSGIAKIGDGFIHTFATNESWRNPGLLPLVIAVVFYCGVPLLFLFVRMFRTKWYAQQNIAFGMLFTIAFPLVLFSFGQGVLTLPWIALLLWCFAADVLLELIESFSHFREGAFILSFFIPPVVWAFLSFRITELLQITDFSNPLVINLSGEQKVLPFSQLSGYALIIMITLIVLALILSILTTYFDNYQINAGLIAGCLLIFAAASFANTWAATGFDLSADEPYRINQHKTLELAGGNQTQISEAPLFKILSDVGKKTHGESDHVIGVNALSDEPLLQWQLLSYPYVQAAALSDENIRHADIIISDENANYERSGFIGMTYDLKQQVVWQGWNTRSWLRWIVYREGSYIPVRMSLWQRTQLLFDQQLSGNIQDN